MTIILLAHPDFVGSLSLNRFSRLLAEGMKERGHIVEVWAPRSRFARLPMPASYRKWLGYIDQYIIFPKEVYKRLNDCSDDTLFVVTDNALGPWVPLIANRPHVIHCHDFMAQQSALGEIPENPTSWTGKQYQAFIHRGYSQGNRFISVSKKTQNDLYRMLPTKPKMSRVVYNGFNQSIKAIDSNAARSKLGEKIGVDLSGGYILHVGGNQWYKNRVGVIAIYNAFRSGNAKTLPLLLIGQKSSTEILEKQSTSPYKANIYLLSGLDDQSVRLAYAGASVFIFPSLAEGFGWPIAEAMASGCPVVTTNEAPMTEVAGDAAFLIPRRPSGTAKEIDEWASQAAKVVNKVLTLSPAKREKVIDTGLENAKRFDTNSYLNTIERIYQDILQNTNQL